MSEVIDGNVYVGRSEHGISCPKCVTGYAAQVETTPEEFEKYGCAMWPGCCDRAFVCRACGERTLARAEAPEME